MMGHYAYELAAKRFERGRNASTVTPWVRLQVSQLLELQWSPEQIAAKLPISYEKLYQHVYAELAHGEVH